MKQFAVIGNPIEHSLSPQIHHTFAAQLGLALSYQKIKTTDEYFVKTVLDFFAQGGSGLNITMPFKINAFNLAQVHTSRCKQAKAANTLWMKNGMLHADTTDGIGLIRDLSHHVNLESQKVLILGAGGAARGIIGDLLASEIHDLTVVNRTLARALTLQADFPEIKVETLSELKCSYDVIINASNQMLPLLNTVLKPTTFCYDLVYNIEAPTPFVTWARSRGCLAKDGFGMLKEQAAESFFIWHGVKPQV